MSDKLALLQDVINRNSRTGIITADRYFRDVQNCFDGGFCPVRNVGVASAEQWAKALKDAEQTLTYCCNRKPIKDSFRKSRQADSIMEFDAIITTTRRDRDGDVLESRGANIDKQAPLLCQHMPMMPIGKFIRTVKRTDSFVKGHFGIADTELGHDYAKLARYGALRISHGFAPKVFEPMEDEQGWHFQKFDVFEVSLVSVPSNTEAVITSVSKHKWASPLVKGWAECLKPKTQVSVPADIKADEPQLDMDAIHKLVREQAVSRDEIREMLAKEAKPCECSKSKDAEPPVLIDGTVPDTTQVSRTLESIETEYIAALAKADIATLRKASRLISLMLNAAEDQSDAKRLEQEQNAWDALVSLDS